MNIAVVLAGGKGTRMGTDIPKQYIPVHGKPVIVYTLEKFNNHEEIHEIMVVCSDEYKDHLKNLIEKYNITKVKWIITGGNTRQGSSFNAIKALENYLKSEDIVLIHDAARPLLTDRIIRGNIISAKEYGAAGTVISATDTIIKSQDGENIKEVPSRKEFYMVQTPQSFKYELINEAHKMAEKRKLTDATDDCQLILNNNGEVHLVQGDKLNFKITTSEDLLIFKTIVSLDNM